MSRFHKSMDWAATSTSSVSKLNHLFLLSLTPCLELLLLFSLDPNTMWTALARHSVAMCSNRASSVLLPRLLGLIPPPDAGELITAR